MTPEVSNACQAKENDDEPETQEVLLHNRESDNLFTEFNPELESPGMWDLPEQINLPGETFQSRLIGFRKVSISAGLSQAELPSTGRVENGR